MASGEIMQADCIHRIDTDGWALGSWWGSAEAPASSDGAATLGEELELYFRDATNDDSVTGLLPKADRIESELLSLGFTQLGVVHGDAFPFGDGKFIERRYRGSDAELLLRQNEQGVASLVFVHPDRQTFAGLTDWIDGPLLTLWTATQDLDILETTRRPTRAPERRWTISSLFSNPIAVGLRWARWSRPADGYSFELFDGNTAMQVEHHWRRVADAGLTGVVDMPTYLQASKRVLSVTSTTIGDLTEQHSQLRRSLLWRLWVIYGSVYVMLGLASAWVELDVLPLIMLVPVLLIAHIASQLWRTRERPVFL